MFGYRRGCSAALALTFGLCLAASGCGGKLTSANVDKVSVGMSEDDVTAILGAPNDSAEVDLPDLGGMMGGMGAGDMGGLLKTPKKAKQSTWRDGSKSVTINFVDGKVTGKAAVGF